MVEQLTGHDIATFSNAGSFEPPANHNRLWAVDGVAILLTDEDLSPRAVVMTALKLEFQAVRAHLFDCRNISDEIGTIYGCGLFESPLGRWRVAVAECGPGNARAQSITEAAVRRFSPDVILFVGVAGSLKGDVVLGDVVASTKVYNYHGGKAEEDFRARPDVEKIPHRVEQLARAARRDDGWRRRIVGPRHVEQVRDPDVHVGPIAAGEQVVAHDRSPTYELIKRHYNDALAVEMEGYGTLVAASLHQVPAIVVRGISDNVTDKAACDDKGWQPVAAANASAFAFELLAIYSVDSPRRHGCLFPVTANDLASTPALPAFLPASVPESVVTLGHTFHLASLPLLKWPTDLGRGEWIPRAELAALHERVEHAPHSTTLVLGGPGGGKSALLARLAREIEGQSVPVLAIKADQLPVGVEDDRALARHFGLSEPVADAVRRLAACGRVAIVIDQLDALASLVDLRPGRLNALLNLVRDVSGVKNVHVVCSCREFERRLDTRLTALDADFLELSLPLWEAVVTVLVQRGIDPSAWPAEFRDLLRAPQHLKVFLMGLTDAGEARVFGSYQQMLDDLWAKRVTNAAGPPGRSDLLMDVASAMAEEETLWVPFDRAPSAPVARFEDRHGLVEWLVGAGVLAYSESGTGLGFSHQTLFEHAWARSFARRTSSLAEYVIARQHGLFVRPTAWAGLNYLRGAQPAAYRREFGALWQRPDLRTHLRHLLVEFLGTDPAPQSQEQAWLHEAIGRPGLEPRVLVAVRGNPAWFALLSASHLPDLMRQADQTSGLLLAVLASALAFARDDCLRLVREVWLPDATKDPLTFQLLGQLPVWDESAVRTACAVVGRTFISRGAVLHVAGRISDTDPAGAAALVGAALAREVTDLERQPDPEPPALTADSSEAASRLEHWTIARKQRFKQLFEDTGGWYGLEEVAERDPAAFLREVWPPFVRALEACYTESGRRPDHFRDEHSLGLELPDGDPETLGHPLPESIDLACRRLAARDVPSFLDFVAAHNHRDSRAVQRLLARGLTAGLPQTTGAALQFLLDDPRRLELGPFEDEMRDTMSLLRDLGPHLSTNDLHRLEAVIRTWTSIAPDDEPSPVWRSRIQRLNRQHRLRLLKTLPESRLTAMAQNLIGQEQVRFAGQREPGVHIVEGGLIGSPMTADQMGRARDADIVNLFVELTDDTDHTHPRDHLQGGSRQASQEFEAFAAAHPARAMAIIRAFRPGFQEVPAGAGLVGLATAQSTLPNEVLFDLVIELHTRGFCSESFRTAAARAVGKRSDDGVGLPDGVCALLEGWLSEPWNRRGEGWVSRRDEPERVRSVLWPDRGYITLPSGSFDLLYTLTYGYLLRRPPAYDKWLTALEAHVERSESPRTWQVLSRELKYLAHADRPRAVRFLDSLFDRHPDVLASDLGARMMTCLWCFTPEMDVWRWLSRLRDADWELAGQAYGELIALRAAVFGDHRYRREVESCRDRLQAGTTGDPTVATGIAIACSRLWSAPASRAWVTDVLVGLVPHATGPVAQALLDVFTHTEPMPPDAPTGRLLAAVAARPAILTELQDGWIAERLERLLPAEAESVSRISQELARVRGNDLGSLRSSWSEYAASLTTISLTLQRFLSPLRGRGLELFETLLEFGIRDAEFALREMDRRIPAPAVGLLPRPRRRRRRGRA